MAWRRGRSSVPAATSILTTQRLPTHSYHRMVIDKGDAGAGVPRQQTGGLRRVSAPHDQRICYILREK